MAEFAFDDPATQNFIRKGIERLRDEFRGIFAHETIQRFVDEAIASLASARVKDYIPLFVNRFARERLQALAQVQGSVPKEVPEVLFVCIQNAGRSQIAAVLLDRYANGGCMYVQPPAHPWTRSTGRWLRRWQSLGLTSGRSFPSRLRTSS